MESKESRAPYKEKFWETRLPGDSRGSMKKKVNLRYLPYLVGSPTIHTRGRAFVQAWGWLGKYSMLSKVLRSKKKEKKEKEREK